MNSTLYVGLMSGTSLDGIDAVVADFASPLPRVLAHANRPFADTLRARLAALVSPGDNEIDRAGDASNELAREYAAAVAQVLVDASVPASAIRAIGCHGQTVRHRPERGFTLQIGNAALLAELSGISVVADFRSRDLAAGGQGAPLVPAFHAAAFGSHSEVRAVLNLGGIANLTWLPPGGAVLGFDCGPGNCLLDGWTELHRGVRFDAAGEWSATGTEDRGLLARLLDHPYFHAAPPKSTGRELFNLDWVRSQFKGAEAAADVQATLASLTARAVADALQRWCPGTVRLIACGGGTRNAHLMARIAAEISPVTMEPSAAFGIEPDQVEALAFAWLAKATLDNQHGNLPAVTGARGPRVLGALYPR